MRWALLVAATVGVAGCGLPGGTDRPASQEESPEPSDHYLRVESIVPATDTLSTRPTLYIGFNDYLEDDAFRNYDTGALHAGELAWGGWADYVLTDKTLIWRARSEIPSGLEVSFNLADHLESVTGSPLGERKDLIGYRTVERDPVSPPNPLPSAGWSDVEAIFEEHCNDCHGTDRWHDLTPLTREALVGEPSAQTDRLLVRPYDPADSYLMHKLLWDYPLRRLSPQPPPWAGGEELPREDLIVVEQWIAAGAPGPAE